MAAVQPLQEIPFWSFCRKCVAQQGDIHQIVSAIMETLDSPNFYCRLPLSDRKIVFLQNKPHVKRILSARTETVLGYANDNFNRIHGHLLSLNAVNTTDPLWQLLHKELAHIFNHHSIEALMDMHKEMLIGEEEYNLNDRLSTYFLHVWGTYCFGENTDIDFYTDLRNELVEFVGIAFHSHPVMNRLPFVGRALASYFSWKNQGTIDSIDRKLTILLKHSIEQQSGVFYHLYQKLKNEGYENAFRITLDNAFLSVLVYDFVYIVMLDMLVHLAKKGSCARSVKERNCQAKQSQNNGFLFPFRFRELRSPITLGDLNLEVGDYCVINLKSSKLLFSYGPRSCAGHGLFNKLVKQMLEILNDYDLKLSHPDEEIVYSANPDIPIIESSHRVVVSVPKSVQEELAAEE